jgi:hypothetical protein
MPDDPGSLSAVEATWVELMHPGSAGCRFRPMKFVSAIQGNLPSLISRYNIFARTFSFGCRLVRLDEVWM